MITREEAKMVIDELFDQQDQLQLQNDIFRKAMRERGEQAIANHEKWVKLCLELQHQIKSLEAQQSNTEQLTCEWVKDSNEEEYELLPVFYTKCGSSFVFSECGIKENNFLFCPYCGGKITQKDAK